MSRAAKTNLLLFILVIILSLIAWFQPGLPSIEIHYLSTLKASDVHNIVIQRQGLDTIKLAQKDHHWYLLEPYQLPANPLRVKTITALAEQQSHAHFALAKQELSRYQLDKPAVTVRLNEQKYILGSTDPIKQQRYAISTQAEQLADNETVHLINGLIFYQLRAALDTFISPTLLPPQAKPKTLSWLGISLQLTDKGWQLTPASREISPESMEQLVRFWQQAMASKVETEVKLDLSDQQLIQNQTIIISYTLPASEQLQSIRYVIVQEGEQIKLVRPDLQIAYWITPQVLKLLTDFFPPQALSRH